MSDLTAMKTELLGQPIVCDTVDYSSRQKAAKSSVLQRESIKESNPEE